MMVYTFDKDGKQKVTRWWREESIAARADVNPDLIFMLPDCWENLIETLRYKARWTFEYHYDIDHNQEYFYVDARVPDRDNYTLIRVFKRFVLPQFFYSDVRISMLTLHNRILEVEHAYTDYRLSFGGNYEFEKAEDDLSINACD